MGEPTTGHATDIKLIIEDINVAPKWIRLEWKAMINNGYVIRAKLTDPYFNMFKEVMEQYYLKNARNEPVKVIFRLEWKGPKTIKTEDRIAYLVNVYISGQNENAKVEFIAMDPPTWLLSRGKAEGKYYEGSVSDVIRQVCQENGVSDVEITKTIDNTKGSWWMMRQDPKTFIQSLLEWSSSITPNKTKWVINSKDEKLVIKEEYDLVSKDFKTYKVSAKDPGADNVISYEALFDNFSHVLYSEEHTAGMSAVSGHYLDKITEPDKVKVYDKNTGNKANTVFGQDRGYKVTSKEFATFVHSIPEDSAGNIGLNYKEYIDGRNRREYLNMLGFITRIALNVQGEPEFDDPTELGVSTASLQWIGTDNEPYFMAGHWMLSGFYHTIYPGGWHTTLYLNRLDFDASARKVGPNAR